MTRNTKVALAFIVVPIVIILAYTALEYYHFSQGVFTHVSEPIAKLDGNGGYHLKSMPKGITVNTSFEPTSQLIFACGSCFMSICYGVARLIKAIRK